MATELTPGAAKAVGMMKHVGRIGLAIAIFGGFWYASEQGYLKLPDAKVAVVPPSAPTIAPVVEAPVATTGTTGIHASAPIAVPRATMLIPASAEGNAAEVRFATIPWNTAMGTMYANGGATTVPGSLMQKNGIKLIIARQDDYSVMKTQLIDFATHLKKGEKQPSTGVHFVNIMGNGAPNFLQGLNTELAKLGPDYVAEIVGVIGYSRGEDKCMGTPEMKPNGIINPAKLRGSLIAEVLLDGDQDLCLSLAADNGIPVNTDESVYDPDAMNFLSVSSFVEADQKWISGACVELDVAHAGVRTGEKITKCVDGVATWTPGDEAVIREKGGLVSLASTKEYAWQMPATVIGIRKWNTENRATVERMLAAMYAGGEAVQESSEKLLKAGDVSAQVYGEQDGAYWARLYNGDKIRDPQTKQLVDVGGSFTSGLADAIYAFGLGGDTNNLVAQAYTTRGDVAKALYPELLPSYPSADSVINTLYVKALADRATGVHTAKLPEYTDATQLTTVTTDKNWNILFDTGKATFTPGATDALEQVFNSTSMTAMKIQIVGHTDNVGNAQANQKLSEARALAVRNWLMLKSPSNYPMKRFIVIGKGQSVPVVSNATADGRSKNRRVEIVMGD